LIIFWKSEEGEGEFSLPCQTRPKSLYGFIRN